MNDKFVQYRLEMERIGKILAEHKCSKRAPDEAPGVEVQVNEVNEGPCYFEAGETGELVFSEENSDDDDWDSEVEFLTVSCAACGSSLTA